MTGGFWGKCRNWPGTNEGSEPPFEHESTRKSSRSGPDSNDREVPEWIEFLIHARSFLFYPDDFPSDFSLRLPVEHVVGEIRECLNHQRLQASSLDDVLTGVPIGDQDWGKNAPQKCRHGLNIGRGECVMAAALGVKAQTRNRLILLKQSANRREQAGGGKGVGWAVPDHPP